MPTNASKRAATKDVLLKLDNKGAEYQVEPIDDLDVDAWVTQIVIKATRARRATKSKKLKDELADIAVYSILTLAKIIDEENAKKPIKPKGIDGAMTAERTAKKVFQTAVEDK